MATALVSADVTTVMLTSAALADVAPFALMLVVHVTTTTEVATMSAPVVMMRIAPEAEATAEVGVTPAPPPRVYVHAVAPSAARNLPAVEETVIVPPLATRLVAVNPTVTFAGVASVM